MLKTVVYVRLCLVLIILDQGKRSFHVDFGDHEQRKPGEGNSSLDYTCCGLVLRRVQMKSELKRIRQINSKISPFSYSSVFAILTDFKN